MITNLCMGYSNLGGNVQLNFQRNCAAGINGSGSQLFQGKRKLELRGSIKIQNSILRPPMGIAYSVESEKLKFFLKERAEKLAVNHHRRMVEVEGTRERPLDFSLAPIHGNYFPKSDMLDVAYERCRQVLFFDRDPFAIGSLLMKPDKKKAFWAIWSWGRRLDEVVDGVNGSHATNEDLDKWEQRIIDTFQGRPWDLYDVAVCDMVSKLPLDILLFNDLIDGTRSDMTKKRFASFDELYSHLYQICSSFLLMFVQAMGISSESKASLESIYHAGITLGIGLGLIDSLRDVGKDASIGRIFLPQDELTAAGLSDDDVFRGKVTEKWRKFMKAQIKRARTLVDEGASLVIPELNNDVKWGFWTTILLYREFLDLIEANDYNCFTKQTDVVKPKMLITLLLGFSKSRGLV